MPLLVRLGALLLVAAPLGCFEDAAPGVPSETETTAVTAADASETGTAIGIDPSTASGGGGCMGCIDAAGGCLAGTLDQACGVLAARCEPCDDGTFCDEGQCAPLPACTPDNCDGCCNGDTCATGDEVPTCGRNGQQCSACSAGSTCNDGACQLPCEPPVTGAATRSATVFPSRRRQSACGRTEGLRGLPIDSRVFGRRLHLDGLRQRMRRLL